MKTVFLCAAFYGLGVFNCAVLAAVCLLHRPRYNAPTLRRKNRDRLPEVRNAPPMPVCKVARDADFAEVGGIEYRFMGQTGEEV
jgi:hypothetical protein